MNQWKALALSFALAAATTPLCRRLAFRFGLLDTPGPRSSHREITPRGGGVAILLAALAGLLAASFEWTPSHALFGAGAVVMALVGLCDDRFRLSPLVRLVFQCAVALSLVLTTGGLDRLPFPTPLDFRLGPFGTVVGVVWIVAVVNFYNFMDGIDGLASLQGFVTGMGLALISPDPFTSAAGASLAGGCLGFLLYNWAPARIFMGDVGSGFLGFVLAGLPFVSPLAARRSAVFFTAASLWLFLADATWTLLRRLARGAPVHQAHREHLYQRLVASGLGHTTVATAIALGSVGLTALAGIAAATGPSWGWVTLVVATGFFAVEALVVRRRESKGNGSRVASASGRVPGSWR